MHHRLLRAVLVAALASAALAASASAATWSTNGVVNFAATTGAVQFNDITSGAVLPCTGRTVANGLVGTLARKAGAGNGRNLAAIQQTFSDCTANGNAFAVTCVGLAGVAPAPAAFDGFAWGANGGVAPRWQNSTTDGAFNAINCDFGIANCATTLSGTMDFRYFNPGAALPGQFAGLTPQNMSIFAAGAGCAGVRLGNRDRITLTDGAGNPINYDITVPAMLANQPIISQP